jgi:hypothetical protein
MSDSPSLRETLDDIVATMAVWPRVEAVMLSGARPEDAGDKTSDLDLYVYGRHTPPPADRLELAQRHSCEIEIDNRFWEPGDEWRLRSHPVVVDIMYRRLDWIEERLDDVLVRHKASLGYTTCFWYNVINSEILFDRRGLGRSLIDRYDVDYPEALVRAVIARNHPVLRSITSSYLNQIAKAVRRDDPVSVNHRLAALLASYFDVVFAANRQPHPGEKRLIERTRQVCSEVPRHMEDDLRAVLAADSPALLDALAMLLDRLDEMLIRLGLLEGAHAA